MSEQEAFDYTNWNATIDAWVALQRPVRDAWNAYRAAQDWTHYFDTPDASETLGVLRLAWYAAHEASEEAWQAHEKEQVKLDAWREAHPD